MSTRLDERPAGEEECSKSAEVSPYPRLPFRASNGRDLFQMVQRMLQQLPGNFLGRTRITDSASEDIAANGTSRSKTWARLIFCFAWALACLAGLLTAHPTFENRSDWQTLGGAFICSAIGFNQWNLLLYERIENRRSDSNIIRSLSWTSFTCALLILMGLAIYYLFLASRWILSAL